MANAHPVLWPTVGPGRDFDISGGISGGIVAGQSGSALLVSSSGQLLRATRAEGCLLEPAPGDKVLVASLPDGEIWVLSVLQRASAETATVALPRNTVITADTLHLAARETRCVAENLTLQGDRMTLEGRHMTLTATVLNLGGSLLVHTFEAMHTVVKKCTEQILQKQQWYGTLRQRVRELAQYRAGRVRFESDTALRVRAENADVKAQKLLDMDAEHIRLG